MKGRAYCSVLGTDVYFFFWLNTHNDNKRRVLELLSSDVYYM
jgi:hypothetical protein